jgi:hypothetical protein
VELIGIEPTTLAPIAPRSPAELQPLLDRVRGADRDRTGDLLVANQTLSQLSYSPVVTPDRHLMNSGPE